MTDNTLPVDAGTPPEADTSADSTTPGSDEPSSAELKEIIRKRDKLKAEKRELEAQLEDFKRMEARRKAESMTLEEQLEALREENTKLKAHEVQRARKQREDAFVQSVAAHVEKDAAIVRALLLTAKEDKGLDIAPEDFGRGDVKTAASLIRNISPSLFEPKAGGPTPVPGLNERSKDRSEMPADDHRDLIAAMARSGGVKFRNQ